MVEKGQRAEENQVSRTSGSRTNSCPPQRGQATGGVEATIGVASRRILCAPSSLGMAPAVATPVDSHTRLSPSHSRQYQAGTWCPHHSCREIHQSLMFRIQAK